MKIISMSDVITNSSSEVFIVHPLPETKDEAMEAIQQLFHALEESIGLSLDSVMEISFAEESGIDDEWYFSYEKGDMIIDSIGENSIPYWLVDLIEDLWSIPKLKKYFSGYYAQDLGERTLPKWSYSGVKIENSKTSSIQRRHLG